MIQAVLRGIGGTIRTEFLDRYPGTTVTVSVYTGNGALKVTDATGTVDSVNTSISADVDIGDTEIDLTSAAGVTVGKRYGLGALNGSHPMETVSVRDLDGSTATLWAPLIAAHSSGDSFHGTRVSLAMTSTQADVLWWDGYAVFTPADGTDAQTEVVDCVLRKIPEQLCDLSDLRNVFPKGPTGMLDAELDVPSALKEARDWFLADLGGKGQGGRARAMTVLGADHFRRPCALKFWLHRRPSLGEQWAAELDVMQKEYEFLIERIIDLAPVDADQDTTTTGIDDGNFTFGRMQRA